jgi:hypothetical protein
MQPMPRICYPFSVGTILFALASASLAADPAPNAQTVIEASLAIQDAMRQGREFLQHKQAKAAVDVLEAQLARVNGNPAYLSLLREAYAAYVKELQIAHQDDAAEVYLKRLQILDKPPADRVPAKSADPPADAKAHAARSEDDPFQQTPLRGPTVNKDLLPEAEKSFAEKRYEEADGLFRRVFGSEAVDSQHGLQWAYSKLYTIVARLKDAESTHAAIASADMEREANTAIRLAADDPKLVAFGRQVLEAVRQRAVERGTANPVKTVAVTIRHQDRGSDGWARAESTNFRLMHNHPREFAEQVIRAAELARANAMDKWSDAPVSEWKPTCEMYLYATAAEYAKATGKPADSPGHATYKAQNGAIVGRRLDLRADDPELINCVLPHETTHLVLGDLFADSALPRWADEGMAVLAEPRARLDRFTRTLFSNRRQNRLVPLERLFAKNDYPDPALITVFYVESVSVVEFLVGEKGPREFVHFVRDVGKIGLDAALQKHYACQNVTRLEERWRSKMFAAADARPIDASALANASCPTCPNGACPNSPRPNTPMMLGGGGQ